MSGVLAAGAPVVVRRRGGSLHRQRLWALWGSYAALAVFVVMFLVPPFYMIMTSLKSSAEISAQAGNPWLVHSPTLANFVDLLMMPNFRGFFQNSAMVTAVTVAVSMVISVLAAFGLARMGFRGSQTIATGVFLTYLIPQLAAVHPAVSDHRRARAGQQRLVRWRWSIRRWRCRSAPGS